MASSLSVLLSAYSDGSDGDSDSDGTPPPKRGLVAYHEEDEAPIVEQHRSPMDIDTETQSPTQTQAEAQTQTQTEPQPQTQSQTHVQASTPVQTGPQPGTAFWPHPLLSPNKTSPSVLGGVRAKVKPDISSMIKLSPLVQSTAAFKESPCVTASPMSEADRDWSSFEGIDIATSPHHPFMVDDVILPPSPPGPCDPAMQEKVNLLLERVAKTGKNYNQELMRHKQYHNPRTVEVLVKQRGLNEHGSNYPKELFDPNEFGEGSYYDELAAKQTAYLKQKAKARGRRPVVEFTKATAPPFTGGTLATQAPSSLSAGSKMSGGKVSTGSRAAQSGSEVKRKSKWDDRPTAL